MANYGHDVEHVDFVLDVDEENHSGALYFDDARLSVREVADVVHAISKHHPQEALSGIEYASADWL